MIQGINQYRAVVIKSVTYHVHPKATVDNKAHMMMDGYMRLTRLLYQFRNPPSLPRNNVNPEQKKNKPSPIAPPVTKPLYLGNSNAMCEYVISNAAKNLNITMALFLPSKL